MSGRLLEKYCPEEGPRNSKMMWLIIALTTAVSPVLLTIFWKYVSAKDDDNDESIALQQRQSAATGEVDKNHERHQKHNSQGYA